MYDPLHHTSPGCDQAYPDSYWASVTDVPSTNSGALIDNIQADVVVIGAGYTGLSCALHLAREHNISAVVLEANQTAWGCSGRNAGFVLPSSGRLSFSAMQKRWGEETMRAIYREMNEGLERVKGLIDEGIECDIQAGGYLKVAHKPSKLKELVSLAKLQQQRFGSDIDVLSKEQIRSDFMNDQQAHGGILYHQGFGVNPLKLAKGYQQLALQAGVTIYNGSPVQNVVKQKDGSYQVNTPKGAVTTEKVVIATNGYTPKNFCNLVDRKTLPVLSQIIVTEPMSVEQIAACNFHSNHVVMDTRALKYYYRKLPDNRILFGGRGAITGKSADDPYYANRLLTVLKQSFPALGNLEIAYAWSGWICMSLDDIPHLYQSEDNQVFYGMGYCGAGVSFSVQAGKRLADKVAGVSVPKIPLYQSPLKTFPMAPLRRVGQWGYFQYGRFKDKYL